VADAADVTRTQTRGQQHPRVPLEDQQRVVHVAVVVPVVEAERLLAVGRILGGVDVEDDLLGTAPPVAERAKPLQPFVLQEPDGLPVHVVLQARQGRLRGQRTLNPLDHGSHRGVVAKVGRVVRVLVSGNDLVNPLPQQTEYLVGDVAPIAIVAYELAQPLREPEPLVELAHQDHPRLARDLATLEVDRKFPLEKEPRSTMTLCSHRHPSRRAADAALASASLAQLESVGGFFIDEVYE
jgi:hypothetical protein